MKTNDLMELVNSGNHIAVEFDANVCDLEVRYEVGMRTRLIGAYKDGSGCIIFKTDESDFADYNKSIEQPVWFNSDTKQYDLKWSDMEFEEDNNSEIYEDENNELYNFKVVDDQKLKVFGKYKESNSELSYVSWLEEQLSKYLTK